MKIPNDFGNEFTIVPVYIAPRWSSEPRLQPVLTGSSKEPNQAN